MEYQILLNIKFYSISILFNIVALQDDAEGKDPQEIISSEWSTTDWDHGDTSSSDDNEDNRPDNAA